MAFYRLQGGKIVEDWAEWDWLELLEQLGDWGDWDWLDLIKHMEDTAAGRTSQPT